jgi:ATP-dependent phosphofructokinase / diphosphate-dependent phosphofructokinase
MEDISLNKIKKIGILTGGGDCSGLNAVIYGVTKAAILQYGVEVVGFLRGYAGLYTGEHVQLTLEKISGITHLGGTILKSSAKDNLFNFKVKGNDGKDTYQDVSDVAMANLKRLGVDALVVLGGDGTLTSARDFARKGLPVVGIPKTIDNDLPSTDMTFGYNTALESIADALDKIHTTAASHDRIMVIEVMGRNAGWLALEGGIAGSADVILIPEIPYDINKVVAKIKERDAQNKLFTVIVVSEGAKEKDGAQVVKEVMNDRPDKIRLGGAGEALTSKLQKMITNHEVRNTSLGYIQRGGITSQLDRVLSLNYGVTALELLMKGTYGHMVQYKDGTMKSISLEDVVGRGQTGETSAGGKKTVDPNGRLVKTAKAIGISFGD